MMLYFLFYGPKENMSGIGPQLPPHLMKSRKADKDQDEMSSSIGPALPPHLQKKTNETLDTNKSSPSVGPKLPPHLQKENTSDASNYEEEEEIDSNVTSTTSYGPALPPGISRGRGLM